MTNRDVTVSEFRGAKTFTIRTLYRLLNDIERSKEVVSIHNLWLRNSDSELEIVRRFKMVLSIAVE